MLGRNVDVSGDIDWHRDPNSEYRWRRSFYADVPVYEAPDAIDVKYVWEVNRHHFLVELARGWLFLGDDRYAKRVRALLLDWIDKNPQYEGVNWTSALEVAVRSISWLWTLAALAEWPGWQNDDWARIARCLIEHATYLNAHMSFYSSPYNHLIGEATGLFLLGRWLKELGEAHAWERRGREVLSEFGPKQFYSDGFCVEQATGYHFFTLGFLVQATVMARSSGEPLRELEPVLAKAFRAGAAFKQPDGRWPVIGDVDSARSIPVYPDDFWDFRSLCSLGAVVVGSPELKEIAEQPGEELFWLLGIEGVQAWEELRNERKRPATVLPDSGYVVASSGYGRRTDWLLFDAGPLAHGVYSDATPSVAHGHADALQVQLFTEGQPLLVDSGIPSYAGERSWADYFRGASAHNTLEVEGMPWARAAGRLEWSNVSGKPRLDANISQDVWLMRGQLRLGEGVKVERNILGLPGLGVWVADFVASDTPRRVSWYWQMPSCMNPHVAQQSDSRCDIRLDAGVLTTWTHVGEMEVKIESASQGSPTAWHAEMYGSLSSGVRLSCRTAPSKEQIIVSFFGLDTVPASVEVRGSRLSASAADDTIAANIADNIVADVIWRIDTESGPLVFAAGVSTLADERDWIPLHGAGAWPAVRADRGIRAGLAENSDRGLSQEDKSYWTG